MERSYIKLYDELAKYENMFPKGIFEPSVKTRSIDDFSKDGLTLWNEKLNDFEIREIAEEVASEIKKVKNVAISKEIGGRNYEVKIVVDNDKMAENEVGALVIIQMI